MPTLPVSGPAPIAGGDLPVRSADDVLELFPAEVKLSVAAPVRDDIVEALTEIQLEYQRRSEQCAAQSDILRADDQYLDGLAEDHGVYPQPNESNDSIRARVLTTGDTVTPKAIMSAINALLAPYTTKKAYYFEPNVDCWFVGDGTPIWSSFVFTAGPSATPRYQDRLYVDDASANFGLSLSSRKPPGAWASGECIGREFIIRVPAIGAIELLGAYATGTANGVFIGNGSDTAGSESSGSLDMFVFDARSTADDVYAAIVSAVELERGQSMRWQAIVDPNL